MGFTTWAVDKETNEPRYVLSTAGPAPFSETRVALEPTKVAVSPLAIVTYEPSLPNDSRHTYQQVLCDALIEKIVPGKPVLTVFRALNVLKSQPGIEAIAMRSGVDGSELYLLWPTFSPSDFLLRVRSDRSLGSLASEPLCEDRLVETSFSAVPTVRIKEGAGRAGFLLVGAALFWMIAG